MLAMSLVTLFRFLVGIEVCCPGNLLFICVEDQAAESEDLDNLRDKDSRPI